jgi:hypothetical protein
MMDDLGSPKPDFEEPKRNNVVMIIIIVVIVLLCCCLVAVGAGWFLWTYGDQLFSLTYQPLNLLL